MKLQNMSGIDQQTDSYIFAPPTPLGDGSVRAYYDRLLKGLAHKLNNQTSVVQGFGSLLLMQDDLSEETRENIQHMKRSGEEISSLMGRVLTLAGCIQTNEQSIQLNEFLRMLDTSVRKLSTAADVPFDTHIAPDLPTVKCDPSRLRELVFELLSNACESASAGGGQVALDAFGPGTYSPLSENRIDIFIRNSGTEFPHEKIAGAFAPFVSTKTSEHFGLGLSVAAVLADVIGARLGISSEDGTTKVWLSIPVAE